MIDVGGEQGTAFRYFPADKFGSDMRFYPQFGTVHVLADCHIFHFGGDDALLGVIHLRAAFALFGTIG